MGSERNGVKTRHGLMLPRWTVPIVWTVLVGFIQIVMPWLISMLGTRHGWSQQGPEWWNICGLIFVTIGLTLYIWCLGVHFRSYRTEVRAGLTPPHLVTGGPYQFSRNPMYVGGLFIWLGWVIFFGNPAVLFALLLLGAIFIFRMVPQEEHQLERLFGEEYLEYRRSVRRWIGRF